MPRPQGTTYRQITFLRAFRTNPAGPPADQWPSPAILRRWLRKPTFRRALQSVQATLRLQTDFLVISTAANAARNLDSPHANPRIADLLRLAHLRQRFSSDPQPASDQQEPQKPKPPRSLACLSCGNWKFLAEKEFYKIAWNRHCLPPLHCHPDFPPPVPQDTFYYKLLHDTSALLWYMKLYNDSGTDKRFSSILCNCKHLIPREYPDRPLPRFAPAAPSDPAPGESTPTG